MAVLWGEHQWGKGFCFLASSDEVSSPPPYRGVNLMAIYTMTDFNREYRVLSVSCKNLGYLGA